MTSSPAFLADPVAVVVFYRLFVLLDSVCRMAGDMGLASCAVLADVAARGEGRSIKYLKQVYRPCDAAVDFQRQLTERELAVVVRYPGDRRALALRVTPKGSERADLVDHALGEGLVEAYPGLSEENFDRLVALSYGYARALDPSYTALGLFPASTLRAAAVTGYRTATTAGRFGMTALQAAMLCGVCECRLGLTTRPRAAWAEANERLIEAQMDVLRERGLIEEGETARCTELGSQRVADFTQRLSESFAAGWEAMPARVRGALGKLLQYALYLFS